MNSKKKNQKKINAPPGLKRDKGVRPSKEKPVKTFKNSHNVRTDSAEGVRPNIMILQKVESAAAELSWASLITMGYTRDWFKTADNGEMYWAYLAMIADIKAILSQETSLVNGRLRYLNGILASYFPKTVPFKTGSINYKWTDVDAISPSPEITVRGYTFYMWDRTLLPNAGGWLTQTPPPVPSTTDDVFPILATLYALLSNDKKEMTKYITSKDFLPDYLYDVSAFAAVSPYFGAGNSASSSTCSSTESEVPYRSNILACNAVYSAANGRVARNFNIGSGDTTAAFGLGLCPEFDYLSYNTRFPVIYKFLDLDEVCYALITWYYGLVQQAIADTPVGSSQNSAVQPDLIAACAPFTFSAQQFRIAVRQVVLYYYANSAALTQFLRYSSAPNSFEPLRCGSNTYPANLATTLFMPNILIENLRMLQMRTFTFPTKYPNKKNTQTFVPVWGAYTRAPALNYYGTFLSTESSTFGSLLFTGDDTNDPNVWDGLDTNNNVCDLNASQFVSDIIFEWNARIGFLNAFSVPTGQLGGSSNGILLTTTRYCVYGVDQPQEVSKLSPFIKKFMPPQFVQKKVLTRTVSKKELKEEKEYYIPPDGTLFSQYTTAFSSLTNINESLRSILNYFIFPTVVIEPANVPTQRQYRVAVMENYVLDINAPKNLANSRSFTITNYGFKMAPGLAASRTDELSNSVTSLTDKGKGGFIGDVIGALGPLLPF